MSDGPHCARMRTLLEGGIDRAGGGDLAFARRHAVACRACAARLEFSQGWDRLVRDSLEVPVPAELRARLIERLRRESGE